VLPLMAYYLSFPEPVQLSTSPVTNVTCLTEFRGIVACQVRVVLELCSAMACVQAGVGDEAVYNKAVRAFGNSFKLNGNLSAHPSIAAFV